MNFTLIIQILKAAFQFAPLLSDAILAAENAFPNTAGAQKLEMVRVALQSAITTAGNIEVPFEHLWPTMQALITTTVNAMRAAGTLPTPAPTA